MGIRQRKNTLLSSLAFHFRANLITKEQHDAFEMMLRRCRSEEEQNQVRAVVEDQLVGWKTDSDRFSKILQDIEAEDDDEDPPALKEALARARVNLRESR